MWVVYVTTPEPLARPIARALVERRVAACANIVPQVFSVYRWEGAVQEDAETLLILKTTEGRYAALESAVKELHPYDTPEIIALPVTAGSDAYCGWVRDSVALGGRP